MTGQRERHKKSEIVAQLIAITKYTFEYCKGAFLCLKIQMPIDI
jgi:hypothetical protein